MKANSNVAVLRTLAGPGAGADVVSEGEIRRALAAGVPPERIVFSGVGKTEAEVAFALETGVAEINLESEPELALVNRVAQRMGKRATVAIRVNPDVEAGGHAKISTGKAENKFGVSMVEAERLYANAVEHGRRPPGRRRLPHRQPDHRPRPPGGRLQARCAAWSNACAPRACRVERLDLGGGLGAPYFNSADPAGARRLRRHDRPRPWRALPTSSSPSSPAG